MLAAHKHASHAKYGDVYYLLRDQKYNMSYMHAFEILNYFNQQQYITMKIKSKWWPFEYLTK